MNYHQDILSYLEKNQVSYKTIHHEETATSEDSARVRGVDLSTGGKALILKVKDDGSNNDFSIFVLSASRRLHTKAVRKEFKSKNVRFATREELKALTDLVPGSVPPFGKPILNFELYVDPSIVENSQNTIAFNSGSLTDSVIMSVTDYLKIAKPTKVFLFSRE